MTWPIKIKKKWFSPGYKLYQHQHIFSLGGRSGRNDYRWTLVAESPSVFGFRSWLKTNGYFTNRSRQNRNQILFDKYLDNDVITADNLIEMLSRMK